MPTDDRDALAQLRSGADVFADAQPPLKKVVLKRGIEMIFALLLSLIDRIEKLEGKKP